MVSYFSRLSCKVFGQYVSQILLTVSIQRMDAQSNRYHSILQQLDDTKLRVQMVTAFFLILLASPLYIDIGKL